MHKTGIRDDKASFNVVWDDEDANILALETAYNNNTHIGGKILDATGGSGMSADWFVTQFKRPQPQDEVQEIQVVMQPTYVDTYPAVI